MREDAAFVRYAEPDYSRAFRIAANGVDYVGTVTNATPPEFDRLALREGRRIDDADVAAHAHVAVLTRRLESRLFGPDGEAVGRIVRVDGVRFRIVGVYAEFAASIFSSAGVSDYIEVPYSVLHDLVPGPVDDIDFWVRPGVAPSAASGAVRATLQRLHGARAGYRIEDAFALLERFERVIAVVSYGLAAIGCVALLVAGIGIMNVMLVSVSERTREIGIRKAIGGSARDITTQFLIEALVLSLVGGTIGLFLGVASVLAVSGLITSTLGPAPLPWTLIVVVAVLFSTAIGVLFGTYPAMRAGRLDPIVALRS
jgi:putative ABC transport system permease protein